MARNNHRHVLIAGAGPAGLAAALFLHRRGVEVEVIDERWEPTEAEASVLLHPDVLERLDDAGVRLDLAHQARAIDTVVVLDHGRRHVALPLAETSVNVGPVAVMPLHALTDGLADALRAGQVKVHRHRRLARIDVTLDRVLAEVEVLDRDSAGYAVSHMEGSVARVLHEQPTYLLAADGWDSVVRTQLRVGCRSLAPASTIVAFEVTSPWDPGTEALLAVGDVMVGIWPAPGNRLRLTFRLQDPHPGVELDPRRPPDRRGLVGLMERYLPSMNLPVDELRWSYVERVEPAVAERMSVGPTWLLGEAAHRVPSLASQSLNHAIRMAHDLAAAIDEVERGQGGPELLVRQAARSHIQTLTMASANGYRLGPAVDPFIAANHRRIVPWLPAHGRDLDDLARRLGLEPMA